MGIQIPYPSGGLCVPDACMRVFRGLFGYQTVRIKSLLRAREARANAWSVRRIFHLSNESF